MRPCHHPVLTLIVPCRYPGSSYIPIWLSNGEAVSTSRTGDEAHLVSYQMVCWCGLCFLSSIHSLTTFHYRCCQPSLLTATVISTSSVTSFRDLIYRNTRRCSYAPSYHNCQPLGAPPAPGILSATYITVFACQPFMFLRPIILLSVLSRFMLPPASPLCQPTLFLARHFCLTSSTLLVLFLSLIKPLFITPRILHFSAEP